ncbi:uncharacterized protein N7469_010971 [Penicillium citrinum]|uniref:Uncharacterized protein n=1 Tax=Penicillium citrinum TaxID=5077 RepID=A0A9W9NNY7_PENCI|nr:uncharacterized protein N7469_010971 [Penicillium citrinum]KAJ5222084.1 hypothetical protein N7469_010971 [Penicillium citrinum]
MLLLVTGIPKVDFVPVRGQQSGGSGALEEPPRSQPATKRHGDPSERIKHARLRTDLCASRSSSHSDCQLFYPSIERYVPLALVVALPWPSLSPQYRSLSPRARAATSTRVHFSTGPLRPDPPPLNVRISIARIQHMNQPDKAVGIGCVARKILMNLSC